MVSVGEDLLKSVVIRSPIYWLTLCKARMVCCGVKVFHHLATRRTIAKFCLHSFILSENIRVPKMGQGKVTLQ